MGSHWCLRMSGVQSLILNVIYQRLPIILNNMHPIIICFLHQRVYINLRYWHYQKIHHFPSLSFGRSLNIFVISNFSLMVAKIPHLIFVTPVSLLLSRFIPIVSGASIIIDTMCLSTKLKTNKSFQTTIKTPKIQQN